MENSTAAAPQVALAYCHNGDVRGDWAECYAELRLVDSHFRRLMDPAKRPIIQKGLYIHRNRNQVCKQFLARTEPWLMFLDTDMLFSPNQFYALYEAASVLGPGVHAGLYYGIYASEGIGNGQDKSVEPHGGIMISSTWLKKFDDHIATIADRRMLEPRDDLDACGMGFTMIHRDVIETLAKKMPNHTNAWFGHDEETNPDGEIDDIGEDTTFGNRVKAAGFKIWGHDNIALGHDKRIILTWEHYDWEQRRMRGL